MSCKPAKAGTALHVEEVFRGKSEVEVISDWTARVSLAGAGAVHRGVGSII